jgi:hypothetical protein
VITYADRAKGKIKAIDGYELVPRKTKEINRAFYSQFPSAEDRKKIDAREKRTLRAWYRKYPTQELQQQHPFETFVPELNPHQIIRDVLIAALNVWGIGVYSAKNERGQLAVTHFMPMVQKMATKLYNNILLRIYSLPGSYNFEIDSRGVKTKRARKNTVRVLTARDASNKTFIERYITTNALRIYSTDLPAAIEEVDAGRNIVTANVVVDPQTQRVAVNIIDTALTTVKTPINKLTRTQMAGMIQPRTLFKKK